MIVAKINGGLANQMFQYAAARSLANHHQVDLMLDLSWFKNIPSRNTVRSFELNRYPIDAYIANSQEELQFRRFHSLFLRGIPRINTQWIYKKEKYFQFDPDFYKFPSNSYLDGSWQSNHYFEKYSESIWNQFQPIEAPGYQDEALLDSIGNSNSIAIHVRRGDYVTNVFARNAHGACSLDYYNNALDFIRAREEGLRYFVFSDDLKWGSSGVSCKDGISLIRVDPSRYTTINQHV
ncbi:MAG: alpha-1,2-fucosyltransferase [Polynucleobacter sp.]|nr:alpha-1,2-fucosyltransferase [Polynucleobacter sp.]